MARYGGVAIVPKDIGRYSSFGVAGSAHHDNRARIVERKTLRHEIVLATDTANDFSIFESIGYDGAE